MEANVNKNTVLGQLNSASEKKKGMLTKTMKPAMLSAQVSNRRPASSNDFIAPAPPSWPTVKTVHYTMGDSNCEANGRVAIQMSRKEKLLPKAENCFVNEAGTSSMSIKCESFCLEIAKGSHGSDPNQETPATGPCTLKVFDNGACEGVSSRCSGAGLVSQDSFRFNTGCQPDTSASGINLTNYTLAKCLNCCSAGVTTAATVSWSVFLGLSALTLII